MNSVPIKVLMISSDRKLFEEGSAVSERIKAYGTLVGELHVVIFALKSLELKNKQLASNVWIYPTNSLLRWFYINNAAHLGKKIVFERKFVRGRSLITTQDPFESGWAGLKVKKKWRIPLEVQLHTNPFSPYFNGFQNKIRKIFARRVLRNANSVRVVTSNLKSAISNLTTTNIKVLPIYIDKDKIENSNISFDLHTRYPWRFILLAVSRLAPEKNLSLALETLALVHSKFPDTGLIIVGSGPEEDRLKLLVKKLKLEGTVEFVGWQNDITSFYKTANAFIQTSFFEGYGLSLIEAGLSGLPVITTPVGFALELEHDKNAYIYPVDHPELFAQGIINLIENNQRRENLRINLRRTLESKLLSKEEYLNRLKSDWEEVALKVD